jgi:hypothetical protein
MDIGIEDELVLPTSADKNSAFAGKLGKLLLIVSTIRALP